ncbi:MAG: hypothetical protein AAGU77_08445 [Bacillota bacterium]
MNMEQMQMMMARMHQQNYANNMSLAQHFQDISDVYSSIAQAEYQMYQMHAGQPQGMQQHTQSAMYAMPRAGRLV